MKPICKHYYKNSRFNSFFSIKFIIDICNKDDYVVRAYAAYNHKCPKSILIRLSEDPHTSVRYNAINNPNLKAI